MKNNIKRGLIFLLVSVFCISSFNIASVVVSADANESVSTQSEINSYADYDEYFRDFSDWDNAKESILLDAENAFFSNGANIESDFKGLGKNAAVIPSEESVTWEFTVSENLLYEIVITYISASEGSADLEIEFLYDNDAFFKELTVVSMKRTFKQGEIKENSYGNHISPDGTEMYIWKEYALSDLSGYRLQPYAFGISEGEHTICIKGLRGTVGIASIELRPIQRIISYSEYKKKYSDSKSGDENPIVIEAEKPDYKSTLTVMPETDRSSVSTTPQSAFNLYLNTLGGENWKNTGEIVTWGFEAKESGIYKIALRFRQNFTDGVFTSRKLYIDGEVPFSEAENLNFNYADGWQTEFLGGREPYLFYLEKGYHTFALEVTMGSLTEIIGQISDSLDTLNTIYRKIVMITGASPDIYRDYKFNEQIPDVIEEFDTQSKLLEKAVSDIEKATGKGGSYTSIIKKIVFQLEQMHENHRVLAKHLEQFKSNLGALGTWILEATQQPLEIDKFTVVNADGDLPREKSGIFKNFIFSLKCFAVTFVDDYSNIGSTDKKTGDEVLVWVQTGRDQAEIVREIVSSELPEKENLNVTVQLVAAGTLLSSVMAGIGPDVALDNPATEPINFALRDAAFKLSDFEDFNEVIKRFPKSALDAYTYKGSTYALPQTFTFPMFFYRTDIFEELGFRIPQTFNDIILMIPDLQRYNLELGIPANLEMYSTVLYQNGGSLYNEKSLSNLNSNTALATFEMFTELYSLYNLSAVFDFANRFRTGEMPCAIQDYTMCNQLSLFAPEIKGLWKMVPIPGTYDENGELNRTAVGTGTAVMMLSSAKDYDAAWRFIKWFTSAETQSSYCRRMESVIGTGAKQPTANTEALSLLSWTSEEYRNLSSQMNNAVSLPNPPGSYYMARTFSFAFNRVYSSSGEQSMAENPNDVLVEYVKELNDELKRKQKEFDE